MSLPASAGIRLGCHWASGYLDVTRAIAEGVVSFLGVPSTIEDVLRTENGLQRLESQLQQLVHGQRDLSSFLLQPGDVTLKAPVLHPEKLNGIGLNYRDHAEESKIPIPKSPLLFGMYANAIVGPEAPIVIPPVTTQVDYEAEFAIVIGARALRVTPEDALNYVAGYTIVN